MRKPYKFTTICDKTGGTIFRSNQPPELWRLQTYEPTEKEGERILMQTKTAYIDTRYEAKIRLYNYLKKNGKI